MPPSAESTIARAMAQRDAFLPVAVTRRGGLAESWHRGAVAVVAVDGRCVASCGDPSAATFARSAAKPVQAVALLAEHLDRWDLDEADLALVCGSHAGTPDHTARAAALLARGGLTEADLLCGAHRPLDEAAARQLDRAGRLPGPLHNNCSGKHAGMLLACLASGYDLLRYLEPCHPLQVAVLAEVAAFAGVAPETVGLGVDGCGAPAFHLPLAALARAYACLADAARLPEGRAQAARLVFRAMTAAPAMVGGPGRFTTRLMEVTGGRLLAKEGAQGLYAVASPAWGLALKIADGTELCRDAVTLEALRQLDALSSEELDDLAPFTAPTLHNWVGRAVGDIVVDFRLEIA